MNIPEAITLAGPHLAAGNYIGGWRRGHVYNQNDAQQLIVDRAYCTGCVVGTMYEAQSGRVGNFARRFYERAKKDDSTNPHLPGSSLSAVLESALAFYRISHRDDQESDHLGAYFRLRGMEEILSWVIAVGPVAMGIHMRTGIIYPRTEKWWYLLGKQWITYDGVFRNGKHAMTLVGVNQREGYVVIQNSWGRNWGNKGRVRMSMDHLEAIIKDRGVFFGLTLTPQDD